MDAPLLIRSCGVVTHKEDNNIIRRRLASALRSLLVAQITSIRPHKQRHAHRGGCGGGQ